MDDLKTTAGLVKDILEKEPKARNSDNYLYLRVLQIIGKRNGIDIDNMSVIRFFLELKKLGFPAFESVRRTRQKLQHDIPELVGNDTVEGQRALNEGIYREYARGGAEWRT